MPTIMSAFYEPQIQKQQLAGLASENQVRQMQVQQMQQEIQAQKAMQDMMQQSFSGGQQQPGQGLAGMTRPQTQPQDPQEQVATMHETLGKLLYGKGLVKQGEAEFEAARKVRKDLATIQKDKVDTQIKQWQRVGNLTSTIHDQPSLDNAIEVARQEFGDDAVKAMPREWNADSAKYYKQLADGSMTRAQALTAQHQAVMEAQKDREFGEKVAHDRATEAENRSRTAVMRDRVEIAKKKTVGKNPYDKYLEDRNKLYISHQREWAKIQNDANLDAEQKAKAVATLQGVYDRNTQALNDRYARMGVVSRDHKTEAPSISPTTLSKAPIPMPATKDSLVAGQKYSTPRGVATWDGSNFTTDDEE
jgi:hypothetical protein